MKRALYEKKIVFLTLLRGDCDSRPRSRPGAAAWQRTPAFEVMVAALRVERRREPLCGQRADLDPALGDADLRCDRCGAESNGTELSVCTWDARDCIVDAEVVLRDGAGNLIGSFCADPQVAHPHVHNARRGCYACRVDRL